MFGNQKGFGTSSAFGTSAFGTTQPAAFGQTSNVFGGSAFGATAPSTSGGLFGGAAQNTSLFGTATTFGQPATSATPGFGFGAPQTSTSMFGSSTPQQAPGTSLFGNTSNAFGQPRPQFGSFAAATPGGGGLFGQPQSAGLFGQTSAPTAGTGLFGTSAFGATPATLGTTIKFKALTGTDTMMKNGVSSTISTSHQCITCMKEYENKSLEELRLEDYAANRKGGQAGMVGFGATTQQSSIFSAPVSQQSAFSFGTNQNKPLFGTNTGTFTSTGGSIFGQNTQTQNVFGKGFGLPSQPSATGFGTSTAFGTGTSVFGQPQQKTLFGQPASTGLFGQPATTTQASTGFGFGSTFGAATQANTFGVKQPFGVTTTSTPSAFSFGTTANTGTSLFGAKQPAFSFGSTAPTAFGTGTTGFSGFSTTPATGTGLFGAPKTTLSFGAGTTPAFGTTGFGTTGFGAAPLGTASTGTGLFGTSTTAKAPGFGFGPSATGTSFGFGPTSTAGAPFSFSSTVPTLGGMDQNAANQLQFQQQQFQQLLLLSNNPYGDNPLFKNVIKDTKREELLKPTNPAAQQALLSQYKVSPLPLTKVRPKAIVGPRTETSFLFQGLDDEAEDSVANGMFVPRRSIKKLTIKPKDSAEWQQDSVGSLTSMVIASTPISTVSVSAPRPAITTPVVDRMTEGSPEKLSTTPTAVQRLNFDEVARSKNVSTVSSGSDLPKSNLQSLDDTVSSLGGTTSRHVLNYSSGNSASDSIVSQSDAVPQSDLSRPPHPAGIVLTRSGYFTIPSMEDLANQIGPDGRCVVDGFTVAREGYGNAYFPGRTDVTGLNLDEIVHFRRREITIYPEDEDKPPIGEGLNKKAQVTLDCVWPNSKATHEPITDPEKLKLLGYQDNLERATAKLGARFLDYRPETGSWVFEVKHFSKYGLEDSDNEADEASLPDRSQQATTPSDRVVRSTEMSGETLQQIAAVPSAAASPVTFLNRFETSAGTSYGPEDDEMEDLERVFPRSSDSYDNVSGLSFEPSAPATQRLAEVLGVSPENVQGMKASFFHADMGDMGDEDIELSFSHPRLKRALVSNREVRSPVPLHSEGPRIDTTAALRPQMSSGQRERPPSPDPLASRVLLVSSAAMPTSRDVSAVSEVLPMPMVLVQPLPLVQSFVSENQHLCGDMACWMGYRFRCGWGPRLSLSRLGSSRNALSEEGASERPALGFLSGLQFSAGTTGRIISLERVAIGHQVPVSDDLQKRNLAKMLEVQLEHSLSSVDEDVPIFVPKPGIETLHAQAHLVSKLVSEIERDHADRPMMQQLYDILDLCVALWGKMPGCDPIEDDTHTYAYMKARKEAFSNWLVRTTKQLIDNDVEKIQQEKGYLKTVMSHLSGHDVSKACSLARKMCDYRLCLELAQGGYSPVTRGMLQKQLDHWRKCKHDRYIDEDRLRVYALLAGFMIWTSSEKTVNCCADLDWKRALALHLWYHCPPTGSISDAVAAYEAAFRDNGIQHPYAVPPYPPYYDVCEEQFSSDAEWSDAPFDTCFHLLKLYCNRSQHLNRVLEPVTSVPSHLDYRISWLLHKQLLSLGYPDLLHSAMIHTAFASQLEVMGLWPWAAFALLHVKDPACRRSAVMELLMRHVTGSCDGCDPVTVLSEDESFLHKRLHVPLAWIYGAKALRAGADNNFHDRAVFLIKGGMWNDAHETVMEHLATDAIIDEELTKLRGLLEPLSEHSSDIRNWTNGGQMLLNYLQLLDFVKKALKQEISSYDLEMIRPIILSVSDSIGAFRCITPRDRLCQTEITKTTSTLLRSLTEVKAGSLCNARVLASHSVKWLSFLEDDYIEELQSLTNTYNAE